MSVPKEGVRLRPLEALAKRIAGDDVYVVACDLRNEQAWGTASWPGGLKLIKLDYSLFDESQKRISEVFYHECEHIASGHNKINRDWIEIIEGLATLGSWLLTKKHGLIDKEVIMQVQQILAKRHGDTADYSGNTFVKAAGREVSVGALERIVDLFSNSPCNVTVGNVDGNVSLHRTNGQIYLDVDKSCFGDSETLQDAIWTAIGHIERDGLDETDITETAKSVAASFRATRRYNESIAASRQHGETLRQRFMAAYAKQYPGRDFRDAISI